MQRPTIYEFPLNERMRNFLRLEYSFAQLNYFSRNDTIWDSQTSLLALIEILNIIDRNDVRSEVGKELERNINTLTALVDSPGIDSTRLQEILDQLQERLKAIQNIAGKVTRSLREDDLLNSIKQRMTISSSVNSFDIPALYFWLNQPASVRKQQMQQWLSELSPIEDGINLLNNLLRDSAFFENHIAETAFFQKSLNPQQACQMIRIGVAPDANYFPETSGNKHRISVRFMCYETTNQRPYQVSADIPFSISCCSI